MGGGGFCWLARRGERVECRSRHQEHPDHGRGGEEIGEEAKYALHRNGALFL